MTVQLVAPIDLPPTHCTSPVRFAEDAATAVAAQVAFEADLGPEVAELVAKTLASSMTPWFNRVAEIERASVARYLGRVADKTRNDGQSIAGYQADAIEKAAQCLVPQVHRFPTNVALAELGPASA